MECSEEKRKQPYSTIKCAKKKYLSLFKTVEIKSSGRLPKSFTSNRIFSAKFISVRRSKVLNLQ